MAGMQVQLRRSAVFVIALFMIAVTSSPILVSATQSTPEATPAASPVAAASASPEQQLIEKYAPIAGLKNQTKACDADGEPYLPVSVDAVLGHSDVTLKEITGSSSAVDEVVTKAPTAQDLFGKGSNYYLDLPGNPRHAGCSYEAWFKATSPGATPTTYAHIVTDGSGRLVVQYWFYYIFNRFNNTHESDWEMMQIFFEVGTVADALKTEPTSVDYAQHGGGETSSWTDTKFHRDGNHPIVYSASGSHASQYD
ncbi:MAG: hypothetical protein ACR2OU_11670, partial [Thermomicrobiales bacterium]